MATQTTEAPKQAAEAEVESAQPQIHVEDRQLSLHDFLKTLVKVKGSDLHLQEGSIPMIRVDGRARFLDCPAPDESSMDKFVKILVHDPEKANILEHKGAVDVSYAVPDLGARFRTN